MTDDPFKNRPEDFINRGMRAAVSALPIVGGPVGEFLQFVIGDPAQERRDDFIRDLHARIVKLSASYEQATNERLRENQQFQATFIQAAQAAARAVQDEKLSMLRNAVLNSAVGTIDETIRQIFMQLIERLTPLHVSLLSLLNNPAANSAARRRADQISIGGSLSDIIEVALPELGRQKDIAAILAADLEAANLASGTKLATMMTGSGLLASRTTDLGKVFLKFISDPETNEFPL